MAAKYTRILSIDGGGIRGIIPAMVLARLEKILQEEKSDKNLRLADCFDLVAGTSTGGIIACGLLTPDENDPSKPQYTASQIAGIYLDHGNEIFGEKTQINPLLGLAVAAASILSPLFPALRGLFSDTSYLSDERYSDAGLRDVLESYFADCKLSELLKPALITSYDIYRRKTHFFRQHRVGSSNQKNFRVRDVAWATAAAPTYFEVALIKSLAKPKESYPLIDGGVFANNPALCAYAEARCFEKKPTAKDMVILSLGTGSNPKEYKYEKAKDWGAIMWAKAFVDITLSGVSETVTYQLEQIFDAAGAPGQFVRIDPDLAGASPELDDASPENLKKLKEAGEKAAEDKKDILKNFAKLLLKNSGTPVG